MTPLPPPPPDPVPGRDFDALSETLRTGAQAINEIALVRRMLAAWCHDLRDLGDTTLIPALYQYAIARHAAIRDLAAIVGEPPEGLPPEPMASSEF